VAVGACSESKDSNRVTHTHGTSYEVGLSWQAAGGEERHGVMTTCNRPDEGEQVTVWVSSRDAVFNRSPFGMYSSVPIAAVVFALGAWGWTWLKKDGRRGRRFESRGRQLELRQRRLRLLKRRKRS
jgi:hypothetical protein